MRLNFNIIWQRLHHFRGNQLLSVIHMGRPIETCLCVTSYSTQKALNDYKVENEGIGKMALAKNLASLMEESSSHFIQKGASDHNDDKEIDPKTLMDAYDSIRVTSNVDLALDGDKLPFESMAEELARGEFDVQSNTYGISTKGAKAQKEDLVFPKLKLRIVQEAIRIALEVVYRPHFSKISHGCRNGRGPWSALRYIRKEISDPDYWFTLVINKNLDDCIFTKLVSIMEEKIEDPGLYAIIRSMFDAKVLNWEFGCFPKGHGLPQEGVLSPILMNVYFDPFDREIYRMSMRYEAFDSKHTEDERSHSKLRHWFRRQVNASSVQQSSVRVKPGVRVHCCRFMEEIFFSISGPKEVALSFKSDIEAYLKNSLHLEVDNQTGVLECFGPLGVQFLGTLFKRRLKESPAVRTVHKLKEKIKLFAEQKQESWDAGTVRIGKKWLAHGLKKVKESEIKHLSDNNSLLSEISSFRKAGMETDHWYKHLLKIWMQDVNAKTAASEEVILAKYIAEPALPQELIDSHFEFQQRAKEYISSETTSTLALLSSASSQFIPVSVTEIIAPINIIKKRLHRYGLTNGEGYARTCHLLVLQDDSLIIDWFSGIVRRWLRWYSECDNFNEVKLLISNQIRMSCIRTLAAKYRMHEMLIEKKFDLEAEQNPLNTRDRA
ncbi:Intron maturase [Abeliophyllum distichum]|uniref:Intron maturase n=1 Tax=Abeliophyllum distichum TaxID=126358 RepID=A0ABD1R0Q3_9LAMI